MGPIGSISLVCGTYYSYRSFTTDPDNDQVRLRFDWGDGNLSEWSDYTDSGTNVSFFYSWNTPSNYSILVIAQDINGSNSNWSTPLTVTVSEPEITKDHPISEIKTITNGSVVTNGTVNQTIIFDASGSIDPNSVIISYVWDFGDGTIKEGKIINHSYTKPGIYEVNLTVTDSNENTFSRTFQVTIDTLSEASTTLESSSFSYVGIIVVFSVCTLTIGIMIYLRKKYNNLSRRSVNKKSLDEQIDYFLQQKYGNN